MTTIKSGKETICPQEDRGVSFFIAKLVCFVTWFASAVEIPSLFPLTEACDIWQIRMSDGMK